MTAQSVESSPPSGLRPLATIGLTVAAGVAAAVVASFGTMGLYGALAVMGVGILAYRLRGQLAPVFEDAVRRARDVANDPRVPAARYPRAWAGTVVLGASLVAVAAVTAGTKVAIAAAALPMVAAGAWLAWPLIRELTLRPPEDLLPRPSGIGGTAASADSKRRPAWVAPGGVQRSDLPGATVFGAAIVVLSAGGVGFLAAGLGFKGLLVAVGASLAGAAYLLVRDRTTFGMFATTVSLTFVLHKSLSAQALNVAGGAISIFVTTFDMMLLGLYGLWLMEGTMLADLRVGMRRRIMWLPLIGALLLLPSLLVGRSPLLAFSELTRMGWMYLLFVYVAIRVRTRRQVEVILLGLGVFAAIEVVVIALQWRTGGVLGLSFLGVPTELGERVTDAATLGRPFGTIIHPVIMGAAMAAVGLLALSVALARKNGLARTFAWFTVVGALGAMYVAHTRGPMVAAILVGFGLVAHAWRRGDVTSRQMRRVAMVGVICGVAALPVLIPKFEENFGTSHFFEEVNSRQELNVIGFQMWEDHPVVGVGLNNFEQVMGPYQAYGVIFPNYPVHNLYLLYLAETGVVGFIGLLVTTVTLVVPGVRLARSRDSLYASIGRGVVAAVVFFAIEELLSFSLRQDIPLAIMWLMAGLAIAGLNLAERDGERLRRPSRWRLPSDAVTGPRRRTDPTGRPSVGVSTGRRLSVPARLRLSVPARWQRSVLPNGSRRSNGSTHRSDRRPARRALPVALTMGALGLVLVPPSSGAAGAGVGSDVQTGVQRRRTVHGPNRYLRRRCRPSTSQADPVRRSFLLLARVRAGVHTDRVHRPRGAAGRTDLDLHRRLRRRRSDVGSFVRLRGGTTEDLPGRHGGVVHRDRPMVRTGRAAQDQPVDPARSPTCRRSLSPPVPPTPTSVYTSDGRSVVFADNLHPSTHIARMESDGTGRQLLTSGRSYDIDPDLSADNARIAYSSYRDAGAPVENKDGNVAIKVGGWRLVTNSAAGTGPELELTRGEDCTARAPSLRCSPADVAAFRARYSPDGASIGFLGALDSQHNCICAIGTDGRDPEVVLESSDLAIDWFDWPRAAAPGTGPGNGPGNGPGTGPGNGPDNGPGNGTGNGSGNGPIPSPGALPFKKALLVARDDDGTTTLVDASPDFLDQRELPLPPGYEVLTARWGRNDEVIFSAKAVPGGSGGTPHPAPPLRSQRRAHYTLDQLDPANASATHDVDVSEQLFRRFPNGTVERLTDPYTEDWRDGLAEGDARSNGEPRVSPDGSTVLYTSTSQVSGESFVMALSLGTGEVLSLTNGTSGAAWVDDQHPGDFRRRKPGRLHVHRRYERCVGHGCGQRFQRLPSHRRLVDRLHAGVHAGRRLRGVLQLSGPGRGGHDRCRRLAECAVDGLGAGAPRSGVVRRDALEFFG
jgi:O-antigen ligase